MFKKLLTGDASHTLKQQVYSIKHIVHQMLMWLAYGWIIEKSWAVFPAAQDVICRSLLGLSLPLTLLATFSILFLPGSYYCLTLFAIGTNISFHQVAARQNPTLLALYLASTILSTYSSITHMEFIGFSKNRLARLSLVATGFIGFDYLTSRTELTLLPGVLHAVDFPFDYLFIFILIAYALGFYSTHRIHRRNEKLIHDLKSPLSTMLLILGEKAPDRLEHHRIELLNKAVRRMQSIINRDLKNVNQRAQQP